MWLRSDLYYKWVDLYFVGTAVKVLLAFSAYTNSFKVLSTHQSADNLNAINGLRFISMSWIILGHTYAYSTRTTGKIKAR